MPIGTAVVIHQLNIQSITPAMRSCTLSLPPANRQSANSNGPKRSGIGFSFMLAKITRGSKTLQ